LLKPSGTLVKRFVSSRVLELDYEIGNLAALGLRAGRNLISLDVADPYLDTPGYIKAEMHRALGRKDSGHYTRIRGLPEFVKSVSEFYSTNYRVKIDPMDQVLSTVGSGEALYIVFASIVGMEDEFVIPNPTFPTYGSLIKLLGGVARYVPTTSDYHLDVDVIKKAINRRTKAIVLCTPNNPTGAIYSRAELAAVLRIAQEKDLLIISDENYSQVTYGDRKHFSIAALPRAMERTIVINGLSKVYAMAGWRLGYMIAGREYIEQFEKVAYLIRGSVNTAIQFAGARALHTPPSAIARIVSAYDKNRHLVLDFLRRAGFECHVPEGGFEVFPRIPPQFKGSESFASYLVKEASVLVKPGVYFGPDGDSNFRVVYCKEHSTLTEAMRRILTTFRRKEE